MNAFICVYRHINPPGKERLAVEKNATQDLILKKHLNNYRQPNNYYDWGDDPSFFAAKEMLNDEKLATWGVCRRDVRIQLTKGDLVIFICTRQEVNHWDYFYIGFGTVSETLTDRTKIWKEEKYHIYRHFYNLLIDANNNWHEPFGCEHRDWKRRVQAPYIFFETSVGLTDFNISNPLHIATCIAKESRIEQWHSEKKVLVKQLEESLLIKHFKTKRKLRINNPQIAHRHISRHDFSESELSDLRKDLLKISETVRNTES